jgi:hypothetical protein
MHGFCMNSEPFINYRQALQKKEEYKTCMADTWTVTT